MNERTVELAQGVYAFLPAQFGSSNAGFAVGRRETLVIDTRMAPLLAEELRSAIVAITDAPVRTVVNTHFHGDHVFGNQVFAESAQFISHQLAREELLELGDRCIDEFMDHYNIEARYPADVVADIRGAKILPADITFDSSMTYRVDDMVVQLEYVGPAHSRGDIVAYLPQEKVLFAADLIFNEIHPFWLDGYIHGTLAALRRLLAWDIDVLVPGHGPITDGAAVQRMLDYFETVRNVLLDVQAADGSRADATRQLEKALGDYGAQPQRLATTVNRFWNQVMQEPADDAESVPRGLR